MRRFRVAVGLWLLFGFTVWNVVFDAGVRDAQWRYLRQQARYHDGRGPRARMREVMDAGIRDSVRRATLWGGGIAAAGVAAVAWTRRNRKCTR